jgi:uncharacterized protein involved in exopolysaccharide biosynthesis
MIDKSIKTFASRPSASGQRRRSPVRLLPELVRLVWSSAIAVFVVATIRSPRSALRYVLASALSVMAIWIIVGGYLMIAKRTFTSHWTLILPTSASSASMQVDSIGHAQTTPSSPFGSVSLSPKVIYKEIIASEQVRIAAAGLLKMPLSQFGVPRIKLIDETALMMLEITGPSREIAQRKAEALTEAFHKQLDTLRRDEMQRRAEIVQESLRSYRSNLQNARDRILKQQQLTGVLSLNQYNESATGLELQRRRLADVRAEISRLTAEQTRLVDEVGTNTKTAAAMLRLSADPTFMKLASEFADSRSLLQQDSSRLGNANPLLHLTRKRADTAAAHLLALVKSAKIDLIENTELQLFVMNGTHRSELLKALVGTDAAIAGKTEELATLESDFKHHTEVLNHMSAEAARLEDLRKDHLVAEAVFTSALARLDTSKIDIYASYPMVQTLAAPDLPDTNTSPNTFVALLSGIFASMLAITAGGMTWLRYMFVQRR